MEHDTGNILNAFMMRRQTKFDISSIRGGQGRWSINKNRIRSHFLPVDFSVQAAMMMAQHSSRAKNVILVCQVPVISNYSEEQYTEVLSTEFSGLEQQE